MKCQVGAVMRVVCMLDRAESTFVPKREDPRLLR